MTLLKEKGNHFDNFKKWYEERHKGRKLLPSLYYFGL